VTMSGVVDYLVERKRSRDARITASLYEFWAGCLWGGFDVPLSRMSAIYQLLVGFIIIIIISSYTANLATIMLGSAVPQLTAVSLDAAVYNQQTVCSIAGVASNDWLYPSWPRLNFQEFANPADAAMDLRNNICDGAVIAMVDYAIWRSDALNCNVVVTEHLHASAGGFVTNRKSWCVTAAINYGLQHLEETGELERLKAWYLPARTCAGIQLSSPRLASQAGRRRLRADASKGAGQDGRRAAAADYAAGRAGRRLAAGGMGAGSAVAGASSAASTSKMQVQHFSGLFLVWGLVSLGALMWAYAPRRVCALRKRVVEKSKPIVKQAVNHIAEMVEDECLTSSRATTIDKDNKAAAGEDAVLEMARMQQEMTQEMSQVVQREMAEMRQQLEEYSVQLRAPQATTASADPLAESVWSKGMSNGFLGGKPHKRRSAKRAAAAAAPPAAGAAAAASADAKRKATREQAEFLSTSPEVGAGAAGETSTISARPLAEPPWADV